MSTPKSDTKETFLSSECWDDFLDFSRMSIPSRQDVIFKRWIENLVRFGANYIGIWFLLATTHGLLFNWRIIAAMTLLAFCAFSGRVFFIHASMAEANLTSEKKSNNVEIPRSAKQWFVAFAIFVTYAMSALVQVMATFVIAFVIASAHAIMRPVINEYYFLHQPKQRNVPNVVHQDGYMDNEEEDEVTFGKHNNNQNQNIRRRSSEGKSQHSRGMTFET